MSYFPTVYVNSDYNANQGYYGLFIDCTNNNITIYLPDVYQWDQLPMLFTRLDNSSNTLTIVAQNGSFPSTLGSCTLAPLSVTNFISFNGLWYNNLNPQF